MRIILKPIGSTVVALTFVALIAAILHTHSTAARASGSGGVQDTSTAAAPGSSLLQNPGFETGYGTIQPYDNKAVLNGVVAAPWRDDSSWAKVRVSYDMDTILPRSGSCCQRITVSDVQRNGNEPNAVQFVQSVKLTSGSTYRAGLWLRADRPTNVELALREQAWPFAYYGAHVQQIGTTWTQVRVDGKVGKDAGTVVLLKLWQPTAVCVDDATLDVVAP